PAATEVGAGTERLLARACEDEHAHEVVLLGPGDGVAEALHHAEGHRVASLRSIDRRTRDRPVDLVTHTDLAEIVGPGAGERPVVRARGVVTLAIVTGVALLVAAVPRASFRHLPRLPTQSVWMAAVALAIQIVPAFVDIPADRLDDLG